MSKDAIRRKLLKRLSEKDIYNINDELEEYEFDLSDDNYSDDLECDTCPIRPGKTAAELREESRRLKIKADLMDQEEEKAKIRAAAKEKAEAKTKDAPIRKYDLTDGAHSMWQYWDQKDRLWRGPSVKITTASAAVGGDLSQVRELPVWIVNGCIHHVLSAEEIERYLP